MLNHKLVFPTGGPVETISAEGLYAIWVKNEREKQLKLKRELEKGLDCLKNKNSSYAASMIKMIELRGRIIVLIDEATP